MGANLLPAARHPRPDLPCATPMSSPMPPLPPMPPMHEPDGGGMADMRAFRRRRAIFVGLVLLLLAAIAAIVVLALTGDDDGTGTAGVAEAYDGTVYVESN